MDKQQILEISLEEYLEFEELKNHADSIKIEEVFEVLKMEKNFIQKQILVGISKQIVLVLLIPY